MMKNTNLFTKNQHHYPSQKSFFVVLIALVITGILMIFSPASLASENTPHWDYGGANNPTQWSNLSEDFAQCASGQNQSPIDINGTIKTNSAPLEFHYQATPLVIVNNGHSIQVNYEKGSFVKINDQEYELLQFHFHTPSEHTIKEKASALEMHLVHRHNLGKLAVVGVMIETGSNNSIIEQIWQNIPEAKGTNKVENMMINVQDLLPQSHSYYSYNGSLTTPPCSENVSWNILTEPITISEEQIKQFQKLYQVNARPIQSLNRRLIQLHS